jgi:hypothetical protein
MMIREVDFEFHTHSKVFDVPEIESKINYLKTFFKTARRGNKEILNIVIAIPHFDAKMRIIQHVNNGWIYRTHLENAKKVRISLKDDKRINVVDVISDPRQSSEMVKKVETNIDYVIFLYPFTPLERNYIGAELATNTHSGKVNEKLHAIELLSRRYA